MSYRKIYSYDDLDKFPEEFAKIIGDLLEKLNKDKDITYPTAQQYEQLIQEVLEKITDVKRCLGKYVRGRNKGKRCQALPHENSNYCLQHKNQDPDKPDEPEPKTLEEAKELLRKIRLNK
jgi:hypothetical protein